MALEQAWSDANKHYIRAGHAKAHDLVKSIFTVEDKKILSKLYGDDESQWNSTAYSERWFDQYRAKNPFSKHAEQEVDPANEHEYVLATGIDASGEEVENTSLTVINATDIKPSKQPWLWPDRIPQGKICWFTGKPGLGKSLATLAVIACITTGKDWPDGTKNTLPPQDVLVAISEDDLATTVIPRLNAAGADLSHVKFYHRVKLDRGGRHLQLDTDTSLLKRALEANPSITLIVLDPLESFSGNININSNKELRPVTDALKRICEQTEVTLVGIVHDNKRSDVSAVQKIPGASALSAASRIAWGFSRDPENRNDFYMSFVKGNLSKKETGLKYTIGEKDCDGITAPYIIWGEEHQNTADDLLNAERDTKGRKEKKQIDIAKEFLPLALKKGPRLARDLYTEAEVLGISSDTLKRAKNEFAIKVEKIDSGWQWTLEGHERQDDPEIPNDMVM